MKAADMNEKLQLLEKHDEHLKRKENAQVRKKQDQEKATKDPSFVNLFCRFQAEQSITNAKNFTIYEANSGDGRKNRKL